MYRGPYAYTCSFLNSQHSLMRQIRKCCDVEPLLVVTIATAGGGKFTIVLSHRVVSQFIKNGRAYMMALAKEIITEMECMICMEYRKLYLLPCGHRLCFVCIGEMIMSFLQTCWILHQTITFKEVYLHYIIRNEDI